MAKIYLKRVKETDGCSGCYFETAINMPCGRGQRTWDMEREKYRGCSIDKFIYVEVKRPD